MSELRKSARGWFIFSHGPYESRPTPVAVVRTDAPGGPDQERPSLILYHEFRVYRGEGNRAIVAHDQTYEATGLRRFEPNLVGVAEVCYADSGEWPWNRYGAQIQAILDREGLTLPPKPQPTLEQVEADAYQEKARREALLRCLRSQCPWAGPEEEELALRGWMPGFRQALNIYRLTHKS